MASGSYAQTEVQCPFYRHDEPKKRRIYCEGLEDKSTISLGYMLPEAYERQMRTFCCEHYKKCEVYRMLMEKYEED